MTWNETHERTRIIRQVEATAAADMSGALPWRQEWSPYFGSPEGLVAALRARWDRMCEAQLDADNGEEQQHDAFRRLRRTQAGVLLILQEAEAGRLSTTDTILVRVHPARPRRLRRRPRGRVLHGPVLPA